MELKTEAGLMRAIQVAVCSFGARLFRNNVGKLQDRHGRWVAYGLCVGSSDLIGWKSIKITEEMIGKRVAVFTACEVKIGSGKLSKEQKQFLDVVRDAGGIAICAYNIEDATGVMG